VAGVEGPRLVVVLVVDQMRADYVERFRGDWTNGLGRLVTQGAWFSNAAFPYLLTFTCAGHATVSTGAYPRLHGVFQNTWYDRDRGRVVACTDDPETKIIRYPTGGADGASGVRLLVPSLADELRAQRPGARVATMALKARSAIMLAGHGGDAVSWLNESYEHWETSSAFTRAPIAAVSSFLDANRIDADFGRTWIRRLPADRYREPDDGDGESPPRGWTAMFPHPLGGDGDRTPDSDFRSQWARSPFADAYIGRFAAALAESLRLGADGPPDFLGVSFSTPDLVGHAFGPRSQEVQDIYAHLDDTIGTLLNRLDALVGRDRYVVALTSDHGVAQLPEPLMKTGRDAGRVSASRLAEIIDRRAQAILGGQALVARVNGSDVYFANGVYEKLSKSPAALDAVVATIQDQPGVARVFRSEQLIDGAGSADPLLQAAALSYVARRSGDLVVTLKPGWMFAGAGTTHGTSSPEDQRVPIILMGRGIKPGQYREAVTPADIAPTLAAIAGIELPRAEGRALRQAMVR
jgi:predicted AlkP superfamily pyrophosphatase or phosphodiesterase